MEQPLNTINYFIAGFAVIFGAIAIYIASLAIRWRNLKNEDDILKEVDSEAGR